MKASAVAFWGFLQIAGCSVGKPPVDEIAKIEAATARSKCVGDLARWHREFYFQPVKGLIGFGVDKTIINVGYSEAGPRGEKPGRFVTEPPAVMKTDDSQHAFAWGRWDRASGRFKNWSCGCNFGSPVNRGDPPICPPIGS